MIALYRREKKSRGYECMTPVSKKRKLLIGYERGKVPFLFRIDLSFYDIIGDFMNLMHPV
jgi:hypothetical protein